MNPTQGIEPEVSWTEPGAIAALERAYEAGKRAWPELSLSFEQFQAHVWSAAVPASLAEHVAEYYLCAACANGVDAALQRLEALYLQPLQGVALRLLRERAAAEDVLQDVRTRLLAASPPKIASYRGSGSLEGWLRRVVVHACQDYLRLCLLRRNHQLLLQRWQLAAGAVDASAQADRAALRRQASQLFHQAWQAALSSLAGSERQLLHHHFVSGLSIDVLCQLYPGHRATIARRIRRLTERLHSQVRQSLQRHYRGLDGSELRALVRDCSSEIDLMATLARAEPATTQAA